MTSTGLKMKRGKKSKRMAMKPDTPPSFENIKFTLNNGVQMPAVGCGTIRIRKGDDVMKVVDYALGAGYRLFAPPSLGGPGVVDRAYQKSLDNLGLDYVDLYLINFPAVIRMNPSYVRDQKTRETIWSCIEELYDNGRVNAIGVSNFTVGLIDEIAQNHGVMPTVNQVTGHPFYQPELLSYCRGTDIVMQAYCSFGEPSKSDVELLEHPIVIKIAKKLQVTCSQVLLVWALQQDVAVIPKSTIPAQIKENITLNFRISNDDLRLLDTIGKNNQTYLY